MKLAAFWLSLLVKLLLLSMVKDVRLSMRYNTKNNQVEVRI